MGDSPIIVTPTADAITDAAANTLSEVVTQPPRQRSIAGLYSRNVLLNAARMGVVGCTGILLPALLTHRLPTAVYGAWTLILQLAGYIAYLDFGIQIAVSKFVAEYTAAGDMEGCGQHASAGAAITCVSAGIGFLVSLALSVAVPRLFPGMPAELARDVSRGVLLVGASSALLLGSSPFVGIFLGLQQYAVPTVIGIGNKLLYALVIIVMVAHHRSLTAMGTGVAVVNALSAIVQVLAWRLRANQVRVAPSFIAWPVVRRVLGYCAVLGIWTAGMLIITGMDTTLVGRLNFAETAFYAIAATPVSFLTMALHVSLDPLMPVASALSVTSTPAEMGHTLARVTRYAYLIAQATGLPLILFGFGILSVWVGPVYARHGLVLLRILVLAHIVRNLCAPYATMVIATGMQRLATWAGVCEAVVNLSASVLLGLRFGAVGVALGTLIGAVVGVGVHLLVSMRRTGRILSISPARLVRDGVLRPSVSLLPTLVLLPLFWQPARVPFTGLYVIAWAVLSATLFWKANLTPEERSRLTPILRHRLGL